uniref:Acetyl-coenzyme A carboxylase carboxyl transferase subunit beta, chloroplastic n=1 Tax=Dendrolobium lanceolatum TaxID=185705 RepID=A0A890W1G5_9FABA|nr:acetyl-CoA carboxylase carboxyltransferase beta subunit [Dendrolobium lanceolatum]QRI59852.1 acetyl-CoA carboxylase carboxyltransferase beta subunit [Dendrolobium lanceolatum]
MEKWWFNSSYSNFISDKTFIVRDNEGNIYSIYLDIENQTLGIDNDDPFLSEQESFFSSYMNNVSKSDDDHSMDDTEYSWNSNINGSMDDTEYSWNSNINGSMDDTKYSWNNNINGSIDDTKYSWNNNINSCIDDTKYSWNNNINSCIDSYLYYKICIESFILGDSDKYNDCYFYSYIFGKGRNSSESESSSSSIITSTNDTNDHNLTIEESSNNSDETRKYKHLWLECENCYGLNYKKIFKSKMNICEYCGYHLKMTSSERIELSIDPGTWNPMDEDMIFLDPIEFHSEEDPYKDRIDSYQRETGLTEAVQTGTGQLNGIPVAIGIMDFQFMGGSMGSVVGEKITRLIEYATNQLLPLILVCASGGARMQEGSLSLMQMAKISSALYDYQTNKKLFYVSILTSPTTGGVTASFGMLGDIIIAEPNAYIAFAGKRVIEQTLNEAVPEGSQAAEYLFHKGLFDSIVPRNLLKGVLSELFQFHNFFSLTQNEKSEHT